MIAVVMAGVFFSLAGLVAYLLYGPGIAVVVPDALLNFGRGTSTAESIGGEVPVPVPDLLGGFPGVLFECEGDKALKAEFVEGSVRLALSDGRQISLPQGTSSILEGMRYVNTDESFVFRTKDYSASLEENAIVTYANCVAVLQ